MAKSVTKYYPVTNGVAELNVSVQPLTADQIRALGNRPYYKSAEQTFSFPEFMGPTRTIYFPEGVTWSRVSQADADAKATNLMSFSQSNYRIPIRFS